MTQRNSRLTGTLLLLGLVGMGLFFLAVVMDESNRVSQPTPIMMAIAGAAIFGAVFFSPVGKAIARMLDADGPRDDDDIAMRFEDVETRLAELSLEQQRVAELEDRLDFTERLLAQNNLSVKDSRDAL